MRQRALILTSLALAVSGFGATSAAAQEEYRHGHIRHVEAGVTLQRATEASAEEAIPNLPFLPGDRVWTDAAGRVAFQFPEGTVVRLDRGSKLDYSDHDESRDERVILRLWSGSLILRARAPESAIFQIETPGGLVEAMGPSIVRVDVDGGETQLSVYEGEASLDTGRDHVRLAAGERTWARWGDGPSEPAPFDRYAQDDFGQWDGDLESREAWAANSRRYLPEELEPYAPEFDNNGTWAYEEPVGYVWQPRVTAGWSPYSNGRWIWTSYGWTWVPYEPWGWVPHHYGRWGFSVSLGWYWAPGSIWGGGWVSWGIGGGYVGWCALGPYNRPVVPWPHRRGHAVPRGAYRGPRGHAVPRGSIGHDRAWSVVRRGDFGRRGGAQHRVDPGSVGELRVADSINDRPDRSARDFTRAAVPRAAATRPRPGASSRAARGASPVPMGSTALGRPGARSRSTAAPVARPNGDPGRAAARSRGGSVPGRGAASSAPRTASPSWVGSSRSSRSRSVARPSPSRGSQSRGSGVTSSPRSSNPPSRGISSRPRSSGVSSRPRSSTPQSSGVSSRSRSSVPRSSGVSSRARSSVPQSGGVSSRPRSSAPRSSGVSSRPRSAPRSSGASSRSRSSAPRSSGGASRTRSSGGSRGSTSRSKSSSRSGSGARSRGGSRRP